MKEEHLAAAYSLAASDIPSEDLFDESTFMSKFPDQTFTSMEREWIAAEAWVMRGDEHYDWLSIGLLVNFVANGLTRWETYRGRIQSIEVERTEEYKDVYVYVKRERDGRVFRVHLCEIRQLRG